MYIRKEIVAYMIHSETTLLIKRNSVERSIIGANQDTRHIVQPCLGKQRRHQPTSIPTPPQRSLSGNILDLTLTRSSHLPVHSNGTHHCITMIGNIGGMLPIG